MANSTNWTAGTTNTVTWTDNTTNTTNFGLNYDTAVVYDSATDNYDGTTYTASQTEYYYDGALPLTGASTNWTGQ